jgi:RNA polymerase primary sigma factor
MSRYASYARQAGVATAPITPRHSRGSPENGRPADGPLGLARLDDDLAVRSAPRQLCLFEALPAPSPGGGAVDLEKGWHRRDAGRKESPPTPSARDQGGPADSGEKQLLMPFMYSFLEQTAQDALPKRETPRVAQADESTAEERDAFTLYMQEIGNFAVLSHDEQVALGKAMEVARQDMQRALFAVPGILADAIGRLDARNAKTTALTSLVTHLVDAESIPVPVDDAEKAGIETDSASIEPDDDDLDDGEPEASVDLERLRGHVAELRDLHERFVASQATGGSGKAPDRSLHKGCLACLEQLLFADGVLDKGMARLRETAAAIRARENAIIEPYTHHLPVARGAIAGAVSACPTDPRWAAGNAYPFAETVALTSKEAEAIRRAQRHLEQIERDMGLPAAELIQCLDRAQAHAACLRKLKKELLEHNLRLVPWIAFPYSMIWRIPIEDLVQEGNIGLMSAVERYNYRIGCKFSTYAFYWVHKAIHRYYSNSGFTIRRPVHIGQALAKLRRAKHALAQILGREPSIRELAEHAELPVEQVRGLLEIPPEPIAIGDSLDEGEGLIHESSMPDLRTPGPSKLAELAEMREVVRKVLGELEPRLATVLKMRNGIDSRSVYSLEEVGAQFRVIRQRAHQLEAEALRKLRHPRYMVRLLACR